MRYISLLLGVALILFGTSCKKNQDDRGSVTFKVNHLYDGAPLVFNNTYTNAAGQDYQINLSNMYVSGLTATGSDAYTWENTYLSISPSASSYTLDSIPVGDYSGFSFDIGIDSVTNHSDPTTFPANSPLNPAHPRYQHWAWNTGYIFVKLEGVCDTANTGIPGTTFFYHLGLDQLLRNVTINNSFEVAANEMTVVEVTLDYKPIFDGLDFSQELTTHTMNNLPLATKVMDATAAAFE